MKKILCVSAHKDNHTPRTIHERPKSVKMTSKPRRGVQRQASLPSGSYHNATYGQAPRSREDRRGSLETASRHHSSQQELTLQILIIGKTGNGKSSTGNTILGGTKPQFEESTGIISATEHTQLGESVRPHGSEKIKVQVIDFPDVTSDMDDETARMEVDLCKTLTYPYPSATCLIVRSDVRFTPEEYATYRKIRELLGEDLFRNMVVVFTKGDKLPPEYRENFDQQLQQANKELKQVLQDAKKRFVLLSNRADHHEDRENPQRSDRDQQTAVKSLLDMAVNMHKHDLNCYQTNELRVVLLGTSGSGKSSTGNSIRNADQEFKVQMGMGASTKTSESATVQLRGFQLEIVDTPGIKAKDAHADKLASRVKKWFSTVVPGPNVLLFVVKATERFEDESYDIFKAFKKVVGEDFSKYVIVVFTGDDKLREQGRTIEDELKDAPESLQNLLKEANNRYVFFDNATTSTTQKMLQRNRLLREMMRLKTANKEKTLHIPEKRFSRGRSHRKKRNKESSDAEEAGFERSRSSDDVDTRDGHPPYHADKNEHSQRSCRLS